MYETGTGTPIIFLHNGGGTLWNWSHQLEYFAKSHRVIAPDLPGFGRSHRPKSPLTLEMYVRELASLLEKLNCSSPILAGNCIGSAIALEFALRYPQRVHALALFNVCGGLPMLNPRLRYWASQRPKSRWGRSLHRRLMQTASHPSLHRLSAPLLYANGEPKLHPRLRQFVQEERRDKNLRGSLYWLAMGLDSFSVFSQPRQKPASFPRLMLGWGSQNRTLAPTWAHKLSDWLKPDEFWLIENAGHMPMYERPDAVNQRLENFFKQ